MSGASGSWEDVPVETGLPAALKEFVGFFSPAGSDANNFYIQQYNKRFDALEGDLTGGLTGGTSTLVEALKKMMAAMGQGLAGGIGIPPWLLYVIVALIVVVFLVFFFKLV